MNDIELEKMAEEYRLGTGYPDAELVIRRGEYIAGIQQAYKAGYKKAREWIKTSERKPLLSDYHHYVLTCSAEGERNRTMVGWIHNHPEAYPYWQELPDKPEGVE